MLIQAHWDLAWNPSQIGKVSQELACLVAAYLLVSLGGGCLRLGNEWEFPLQRDYDETCLNQTCVRKATPLKFTSICVAGYGHDYAFASDKGLIHQVHDACKDSRC